ncbi:MAG: hypothetical protein AMJ79_04160 [Phycisphaerae bacterium SM23_30]|nr:MAG: hypothetical protein AMJ79_04160 [Phycisphaerae bacterium SM23_30]
MSSFPKKLAAFSRTLLLIPEFPYRWLRRRLSPRRNILFNVVLENHFDLFAPVYHRLRKDPRLQICFTNSQKPRSAEPDFCRQHGLNPSCFLPQRRILLRRWDLCIEADYAFPLIARPACSVQTFHGNADKVTRSGRNFILHRDLKHYDALFCMSPDHVETLHQAGLLKHKKAAFCIGYPKLDALVDGSIHRDEVLKSYGADPSRRSVLYAPSWDPQLSLEQIGTELINLLSGRRWAFLVKPHPKSFHFKPNDSDQKAPSGKDWKTFLDQLHRDRRLIHLTDQNTSRYLTAADVLITDHGSTLFEYMILDRPILYYDTPQANAQISFKNTLKKIRAAAYSFQTPDQALQLLKKNHIPDKTYMAQARKELFAQRFYQVGTATDRAVAAIYKLLKLPLPDKDHNLPDANKI